MSIPRDGTFLNIIVNPWGFYMWSKSHFITNFLGRYTISCWVNAYNVFCTFFNQTILRVKFSIEDIDCRYLFIHFYGWKVFKNTNYGNLPYYNNVSVILVLRSNAYCINITKSLRESEWIQQIRNIYRVHNMYSVRMIDSHLIIHGPGNYICNWLCTCQSLHIWLHKPSQFQSKNN